MRARDDTPSPSTVPASRRALVLGLGRFGGGREAALFLHRRGFGLRIADRADAASLEDSLAPLAGLSRVELRLGCEEPGLCDGVDLVVANPAIPPDHPVLREARERGLEVTQEVALFLEHYPGRVVLVTGTNGKSTTTTLIDRALGAAGIDHLCGGNIGHSLLGEEHHWRPDQVAVLEISSFQLERLPPGHHRAAVAVLTRVTRDHLDRHGTVQAYQASKAVAAACAEDALVHCADDPVAEGFATTAPTRVRYRTSPPRAGEVGVVDGFVVSRLLRDPGVVLHEDALALFGDFHVENVMAAFAAAMLCGADRPHAALALAQTGPLPYRLQLAFSARGIRLYDNSVSTEVESTQSALRAVHAVHAVRAVRAVRGAIRWVGGGKSKDGDFAGVARALLPHLGSAHLFGAAALPMQRELSGKVQATVHERLEAALDAAWQRAEAGDAVLFSPAFASFDQYHNFRARAEAFRAWLRTLREGSGADGSDGSDGSDGGRARADRAGGTAAGPGSIVASFHS